jgi:hypothetical protein
MLMVVLLVTLVDQTLGVLSETRLVVELLVLRAAVIILLILMLNFELFLMDCILAGILSLEISFVSQILKRH